MTTNSPNEIAKWFINRVDRESGETISHLKLQKLLYYAQAWHLANFGSPLFEEDMQAWTHGPVVPSVWDRYKDFGWEAIPAGKKPRHLDPEIIPFLDAVFEHYGGLGAKALENRTHNEDPWRLTRGNIPLEARCTKPISKQLMRDFYGKKISKKPGDYETAI